MAKPYTSTPNSPLKNVYCIINYFSELKKLPTYGTAQFKLDIYMCVTRDFLDKFLVSLASYTQANIKIYIYMHVTLELLDKFIRSLMSSMQGVNKFVLLLANSTKQIY